VTFKSQSQRPVVVLLTGILDPQNLGAILRSAYYFGIAAVVLPLRKRADPDTPATLKAASGASEGINILQCEHALDFVQASRMKGWYVMGAMPPPPEQQENVADQGKRGKKVRYRVDDRPRLTIPTMSTVLTHLESPSQPILLVLGGEQEGISYDFCRSFNAYITIKRNNIDELGVDSLNVSVAAGLIFAEVTKNLPSSS
jgi:21S rRNA (GM2251-2'-O)-methyltransferase